MRSWSRMAALIVAVGLVAWQSAGASLFGLAEDEKPRPGTIAEKPAPPQTKTDNADASATKSSPEAQAVRLKLLIAGLSKSGCDVDIKPGNRSCRFQPQTQHVGSAGELSFQFKDIQVLGADRNCTFAITVREAGQSSKTIYRGFRLPAHKTAATEGQTPQTFTCFMNCPSKLADLDRSDRTRQ